VQRQGDSFCVSVDGSSVGCGAPPTLGRAWRWLEPRFERLFGQRPLDAVTMFCLFLPLGFWGWGWRGMPLLVLGTASGLLLIPTWTGLGASPWFEWSGAALGLAAALVLTRTGLWRRKHPAGPDIQHQGK